MKQAPGTAARPPALEEQCPICLQLYAYEMEVRCVECDTATCPFCSVRILAEWSCTSCREETDAGAGDVEG